MAQSPLITQPLKSASGQITSLPPKARPGAKLSVQLKVAALDLQNARIVWEAKDHEPAFGNAFTFTLTNSDPVWIEAVAQLPDGRRAVTPTNFPASTVGMPQ